MIKFRGAKKNHYLCLVFMVAFYLHPSAFASTKPWSEVPAGTHTPTLSRTEVEAGLEGNNIGHTSLDDLSDSDHALSPVQDDPAEENTLTEDEKGRVTALMTQLSSIVSSVVESRQTSADVVLRAIVFHMIANAELSDEEPDGDFSLQGASKKQNDAYQALYQKVYEESGLTQSRLLIDPDILKEVTTNHILSEATDSDTKPLTFVGLLRLVVHVAKGLLNEGFTTAGLIDWKQSTQSDQDSGIPYVSNMDVAYLLNLSEQLTEGQSDGEVLDRVDVDFQMMATHFFLNPPQKTSPWNRLLFYLSHVDDTQQQKYLRMMDKIERMNKQAAKKKSLVVRVLGREFPNGYPAFLMMGRFSLFELVEKAANH